MSPEKKNPSDADEQNARIALRTMRAEIKRILDAWDPLCLRGLRGFDREYNDHVGPLFVLVRKGAEPMEIARHLHTLMTEEWKLPENRAKCVEIAEKIHRVGKMFQ